MSRQTTREMILAPSASGDARSIRASGMSPGGAEVTGQMIAGELAGRNIWGCGASNGLNDDDNFILADTAGIRTDGIAPAQVVLGGCGAGGARSVRIRHAEMGTLGMA